MNQQRPRNIGKSVKTRLLSEAKKQREESNGFLNRYGSNRFLYRLSQSRHKDLFILKGATVFTVWNGEPHRATKDVDLLGRGTNDIANLIEIFKEICKVPCEEDGVVFLEDTIKGEKIKEDQEYEGVRIKLKGKLDTARLDIQIDVGFGDAITPAAQKTELPTFLNLPAPSMRIYPRETVVAEKFQAMVSLGIKNSRIKDFYDVLFLSQQFEFQGDSLCKAFKATFERRKTDLPVTTPFALTDEFAKEKQKLWKAFIQKGKLKTKYELLIDVIVSLREFLMPPCLAAAKGENFQSHWIPPDSWQ